MGRGAGVKICVPSYRRAKNCIAAKWLKRAVIFCHDFEEHEYRRANQNGVCAIPDRLAGKGMAVIRNAILDRVNEDVLMVDDDVEGIQRFEGGTARRVLSEAEVYGFIEDGFRMAKEARTVLWGVNVNEAKKFYRQYTPFSFSSIVLGTWFGVRKTALRFDPRLGLKEDYDFCVQVLNKYRRILRFNKYHYLAGHLDQEGGCSRYRSMGEEEKQLKILVGKWGREIVRYELPDTNPVIRVPIPGV